MIKNAYDVTLIDIEAAGVEKNRYFGNHCFAMRQWLIHLEYYRF